MAVWGVHGLEGVDFLREGVILLERPMVGDLVELGDDRHAIKRRLATAYPRESPRTVAAWAGVLRRFAFDPVIGDLVIHPDRAKRTVSVGAIVSGYAWDANGGADRHVRRIHWLRTGVSRDRLSSGARTAVSARVAFFSVARCADEFGLLLSRGENS